MLGIDVGVPTIDSCASGMPHDLVHLTYEAHEVTKRITHLPPRTHRPIELTRLPFFVGANGLAKHLQHFAAYSIQIAPKAFEHGGSDTFAFASQPEQEVLGANVIVVEALRLFLASVSTLRACSVNLSNRSAIALTSLRCTPWCDGHGL